MIAFIVPPLTLEIADGDLAAEQTDAVVNAANNAFWMGSGVAGALKARGGQSIEAEAMAQGPVEPGECVITSGGQLAARYVIHAAVMGQDLRTSAAIIERATRNSLALAETRQITSIAFPAFGTGVGGFPDRSVRAPDDCGHSRARVSSRLAAAGPPRAVRIAGLSRGHGSRRRAARSTVGRSSRLPGVGMSHATRNTKNVCVLRALRALRVFVVSVGSRWTC